MPVDFCNSRRDVVSKTDSAGDVTWEAAYEAFGTRTAENGNTEDRQKANTKDEDPTGLLNEHFRYRDLEAGTFITRDPAGFVDGPNVYTYVRQNPWTYYDPLGLYSWIDGAQDTLSAAGLFPGLGIIPDAANTVISLGRGNWADAGMNGLAMIPIAGQVATGAKYADKAIDKANDARKAADKAGDAKDAANTARKIKEAKEVAAKIKAAKKAEKKAEAAQKAKIKKQTILVMVRMKNTEMPEER